MNSRCGERSGLETACARFRSKLLAYSRHERTPCFTSILLVQSGFGEPGRSTRYNCRKGNLLGGRCSRASIVPALDSEAPTKLRPTGSNLPGGSWEAAYPAQKLWRSPETIAKPVIFASRTRA